MKSIIMVRIYLTEAEGKLGSLLKYLHDDGQVRGVTVMRGITGFGQSGRIHAANLVELSLDLPLVVEFFDTSEKVTAILPKLYSLIEPNHIVYWAAQAAEP
jgi:hypothetical protein